MRILPFPEGQHDAVEDRWLSELEAALSGERGGPDGESWRELREDVRALAPPIAPEFDQRLREELLRRSERSQIGRSEGRRARGLLHLTTASTAVSRLRVGGAVAAVAAAVVVLAVALLPEGRTPVRVPANSSPVGVSAGRGVATSGSSASAEKGAAVAAPAASAPPVFAPLATPAAPAAQRRQQRSASVSLSAAPAMLQTVSDSIARLAERSGGFVQSSHVQIQRGSSSEATLTLSLPSARLDAALAAIGRLAPVLDESRSLQDITGAFDAAHQRLADALAERDALLRALAKASTEAQIAGLRERLSHVRRTIAAEQSSLRAVTTQASTSEVEVSVIGNATASAEGLTLHRGLKDAGHVLLVALVALLIAGAVLVPLAILCAALFIARRLWLRHVRERALGGA
jgi:hypothetical protein